MKARDTHSAKDPERVRLGRLGALSVHARGRTNVGPARAAWERQFADTFEIGDELDPVERQRRMEFAIRFRMTELARTRWSNRKAVPAVDRPGTALEVRRARVERPPAA